MTALAAAQRVPVRLRRLGWPRAAAAGVALAIGAALLMGVYAVAEERATSGLARDARVAAQLQVAALQSELEKQRSAPAILADDSDVRRSLAEPSTERGLAISRKLAKLRAETKSAEIYVIDRQGTTRSASNYDQPDSFVGSNYAFRRYFADALKNGTAEQFALGTVSLRPGLYIAHRIVEDGQPLGVVVVKVEFDGMEAAWRRAKTSTFVTDSTGRILLTSVTRLRFATAPAAGPSRLATTLPASENGWRLTLVSSKREARDAARSATLIAGLALALAASFVAWMWRRRKLVAERAAAEAQYRDRLERDVAARTQELSETNARLSDEIHERHVAERRLNVLQADLVQANKLAQLGQITAGVAHEVNQPLATIRALAENSLKIFTRQKARPPALVEDNLGAIVRMSDRIAHITGELRAFSRKATGDSAPVSLKQTLDSSVLLNKSRLRHNRVRLHREAIDADLKVVGGRIRLEQVIVNLLQNAFEALDDTPDPVVRISATVDGDWVWLRISDNGPGLAPEVRAQLFTPFVTTKEKGLGLGLVIARDILREFGGDLTAADDGPGAGAMFTLKLKKVP
ncbi:MAG TPA: ATP-binding protein [Caulobacteraceae bacterium]